MSRMHEGEGGEEWERGILVSRAKNQPNLHDGLRCWRGCQTTTTTTTIIIIITSSRIGILVLVLVLILEFHVERIPPSLRKRRHAAL